MTDPDPIPSERPEACVLVIFGASGDLTKRKLLPALFALDAEGMLPDGFAVLGVARSEKSDDEWRQEQRATIAEHADFTEERWRVFADRLHYLAADATETDAYPVLTARLNEIGRRCRLCPDANDPNLSSRSPWITQPNTLFYLSVAPALYPKIIERIGATGMILEGKRWCTLPGAHVPWQRIIVEKPIGHDLASAEELNRVIGNVFDERDIFRIDHYLGKELVQNIMVMRFANTIFEPLWNADHVDHIQLTAAESLGVGRRAGNFYDAAGATRDMIQSHLLQVLSLILMEPPTRYDSNAIRREKLKVLESTRPIRAREAHLSAVFGRYDASENPDDEDSGLAYTELDGVDPKRATETFSAMRLFVDNWRWSGTPVFIRSGKKLARKLTEVVIQFKHPPAKLFQHIPPFSTGGHRPPNRIVINIAPDEGVSLRFEAKVPGNTLVMDSVKADLDYNSVFRSEPAESYGPLLLEAMRGDQTHFMHRQEVEATWAIVEPVVKAPHLRDRIETYPAGSWGPQGADHLIASSHRQWHNPRHGDVR
ncbi:MAG: glucose-6-phosphate dehydrogenase [Phycisphaerales bacterium]